MGKNFDNIIINRVIRGTMFDRATDEVMFTIDQISDPQLECSGESVFVMDAIGQKIAAFDRSKDAKFTGSNALINFGLMAAQLGSKKTVASSEHKLTVPACEIIEVENPESVELKSTPVGEVKYIYSTLSDKSKNETFTKGMSASETQFAIAGKKISLPTSKFKKGDRVIVFYNKEVSNGVGVKNTTDSFGKNGRFVLEVLGQDVCDSKEYYMYLIFPNSKMENNVSITFNNEAKHGFTINALQDYCSINNELFSILVAGDE